MCETNALACLGTVVDQDNAMSDYFAVKCFHEDWSVGVGLKVLCCYHHLYPELKGCFPRAAKLYGTPFLNVSETEWRTLAPYAAAGGANS